jgi:trimethylamine---corrinoid protein Co-methyltransferase
VHDIGYLGQGLIASPAAIVMCNELIGYVKRIMRGFDISRERLGLDAIRRVGPGGDFLSCDHTFEHHREEIWTPSLLNRQDPEEWKKAGRPRYGEVVTRKALEILEHHRPEPLAPEVDARLTELAAGAEQALAGKFFEA